MDTYSDPERVSLSDHLGDGNLNLGGLVLMSPSRAEDVSSRGHNRTNSASSTISNSDLSQGTSNSDEYREFTQPAANIREPTFSLRLEAGPHGQPIQVVTSAVEMSLEVKKLVEDLKNGSLDAQRNATSKIRLLAKHNVDNRIIIANSGAIDILVDLLRSTDSTAQESCVTALLNLSINDNNKSIISNAGAIEPLIHVLETGSTEAKENTAATLYSLSMIDENRVKIGELGGIEPLINLLGNGTPSGKRDATTALFNLSLNRENRARIVQGGAVKYLVELMDPAFGLVDKAVSVLSNLATIYEGRTSIGEEGGIPKLVEVIELGSGRGKENAAAALLQLCVNRDRFCNMVLQEGAIPPLLALALFGTPRAREKAQQLLSYFRSRRHDNIGRG